MNKSDLFRLAWANARRLASRTGETTRRCFSVALRRAWASVRAVREATGRAELSLSAKVKILADRFAGLPLAAQQTWHVQFVFAQSRRLRRLGGEGPFIGNQGPTVERIWAGNLARVTA